MGNKELIERLRLEARELYALENAHGCASDLHSYASWHAATALEAADKAEQTPVAWRVKDFADGWVLFRNEAAAKHEAFVSSALIQPLYLAAPAPDVRGEVTEVLGFYADTNNYEGHSPVHRTMTADGGDGFTFDDGEVARAALATDLHPSPPALAPDVLEEVRRVLRPFAEYTKVYGKDAGDGDLVVSGWAGGGYNNVHEINLEDLRAARALLEKLGEGS